MHRREAVSYTHLDQKQQDDNNNQKHWFNNASKFKRRTACIGARTASLGAAGTCAGRFFVSRAGRGMSAVPAKAGRSGGWSCTSGSPGGFFCVIVVICEGVDLLRPVSYTHLDEPASI